MNSLQNYILFSSDRGGMRIEYAKHKMGENTNLATNCNNLPNNCTNSAGQNQNQMQANANSINHANHVNQTNGNGLSNHLNNVPSTTVVTQATNHVNHLNHTKGTNQVNTLNNNLNSIGANVSIVNCNSPVTNQQPQNSVVIVSTGQETNQPQLNGAIIPVINHTSGEQMEIVSGIEQCQYAMLVNYATRLILLYIIIFFYFHY